MALPESVTIREVGLRDGLQNWHGSVSTGDKLRLLSAVGRTGITRIEATAFVAPAVIPQLSDAEALLRSAERSSAIRLEALVPNVRGADRAIAAGVDAMLFVVAASDSFNLRNVRMTTAESLERLAGVKARGDDAGMPVALCIATAFGCPFEGAVPVSRLLEIAGAAQRLGIDELFLADTTGVANPAQVEDAVRDIARGWPALRLGLHLHDTRGMGLANVVAGLRGGARTFDTSFGGLGGCPFAPGALGNIATEDTVHLLHEMGVATGTDPEALAAVARLAEEILGERLHSKALRIPRASPVLA